MSRTASPSAMVSVPTRTGSSRRRCAIAGKVVDSTPITSMSGRTPRAADGAAGQQAATTDRNHQRVEVGCGLQHSSANVP